MYIEEIVEVLNRKLSDIKENDNAVLWGMGEYTEKVFFYTEICNCQFKYFVDNYFNGQKRFGKEIKSPQEIMWEQVSVVVILSFYRWQEIKKELIEKFDYKGKIIVLNDERLTRPFYKYESRHNLNPLKSETVYLEKNKEYENKFIDRKCYILGNGPSLKMNSIKKIKKEVIFSVNEFFRYDKANMIKPDYYVVADPAYFDLNQKANRDFFTGLFSMIKINPNIKFWFPLSTRRIIEGAFYELRDFINYFSPKRELSFIEDNRIDFTENVPSTYSVVQYAILLAIYMGFNDIRLLGCEQTNIIDNIRNYLGDMAPDYVYSMSDEEEKWCIGSCKSSPLDTLLYGYYNIFKGYRVIYDICIKRKIKITNCTDKTLIQGIPRGDFVK